MITFRFLTSYWPVQFSFFTQLLVWSWWVGLVVRSGLLRWMRMRCTALTPARGGRGRKISVVSYKTARAARWNPPCLGANKSLLVAKGQQWSCDCSSPSPLLSRGKVINFISSITIYSYILKYSACHLLTLGLIYYSFAIHQLPMDERTFNLPIHPALAPLPLNTAQC